MIARLLILTVVLLGAAGVVARATRAENVPPRQSLAGLPREIGGWQGRDARAYESNVLRVLGVDEYVNRIYTSSRQPWVSLYVGYYTSQRQGDTIHSPMNCLPGAGWQPVRAERIDVPVSSPEGSINVNRYVIQRGIDKQVVLYWYQSHGRVIASEYWSKTFMVYDAVRLNRTDAALVRVISPLASSEESDGPATERATRFVQALFPMLGSYLPS